MNRLTQYPVTDKEWSRAFNPEMSPAGFDRLLRDLGYCGTPNEPTIQDLALLSDRAPDTRVAPCGHVIEPEEFTVSMDCYEALLEDYTLALDRRNRAEKQVTLLRVKLRTAKWLLCILYVVAACLIAARIGGM